MAPISFARGAPSLDIIDVEGLRESAQNAFTKDPGGSFAYGTSVGYVPLREWIADVHQVAVEQVLVTNGSMQADAFLFDVLVEPGDAVVTESPTYDRTLLGLSNRGAAVTMIPLETDGIDVVALERELKDGLRPKLAHIIPNFQNPAGYTLSAPKRAKLLELAREYEFVLFEDDPYMSIRFTGDPLPTMFSQDDSGTVIYASSFSKTVCPGIRVGYVVGPPPLIKQIQTLATNTYISPNMVAQSIVNEFCRSGRIDSSIETVKNALRDRVAALTEALSEHLPEARFAAPEGGYFMWVELPEGTDVAESRRPPRSATSCSSRAPTSCSRAARTRSGSPTAASTSSRSARASRGSRTPTDHSAFRPRDTRAGGLRAARTAWCWSAPCGRGSGSG